MSISLFQKARSRSSLLSLCLFVSLFVSFFLPSLTTHAALTDGLVGHWTFDGRDTNWSSSTAEILDTSGNGLNANAVNLGTSSATVGKIGQGLAFDGVDEYVNAGRGQVGSPTNGITITLWVYTSNTYFDGSLDMLLADNQGTPASENGFWLNLEDRGAGNTTNGVQVEFDVTTGARKEYATNVIGSTPAWYHITALYNPTESDAHIFINGTEVTSTVAPSGGGTGNYVPDTDENLFIGALNNLTFLFNGKLDDVRIYNRALSASEVRQLYNQGAMKLGVTPSVATTTTGINAGLVGYWTFDGKNTNWSSSTAEVLDSSGSGVNGNAVNMGTSSATIGKIGQALNFNGTNSRITASPTVLDAEMSVFAWIKPTTVSVSQNIIGDVTSGNTPGLYLLMLTNQGKLAVIWNGFVTFCLGNRTIKTNEWQLVGFVRSGSSGNWSCAAYVNGELDTSASSISTNPLNQLNFGIGSGGTLPFSGGIDDVRIYNRVLSAAEIRQLYNQGAMKLGVTPTVASTKTGISNGLVGHWTFDGKDTVWTSATAATTLDKSGNGNTGTLTNMSRSTSTVAGKLGQGLNFYGGNGYVNVSDNVTLRPGNGSWSMSAWAKPNNINQMASIIAKRETGGDFEQYNMIICNSSDGCNNTGKYFQALFRTNSSDSRISKSSVPVVDGNWHHFVAVADKLADEVILYVDGQTISYITTNVGVWPTVDNTNAFEIGSSGAGTNKFNGSIDNVSLYNRALTASEVYQLYRLGNSTVR